MVDNVFYSALRQKCEDGVDCWVSVWAAACPFSHHSPIEDMVNLCMKFSFILLELSLQLWSLAPLRYVFG